MYLSRCCLILFAFMFIHASSFAGDESPTSVQLKELKLLAIGNSFSGNASHYLPEIVRSGGSKLVFGHASIGGCSIEKHLKLALQHEKNPEDPQGKPYKRNGVPASLKDFLTADNWQVITIQQASILSFRPESFTPFAKELCDYIKKYAPQAEIVIHETWAYRADDKVTYKNGFTQVAMYQGLVKCYNDTAAALGIKRIIPVGDAFQLSDETPGKTFVIDKTFDMANAIAPALPEQVNSLMVGYSWDKGKIKCDYKHANVRGEYLAGLVWFEKLFNGDATKVTYKPKGINDDDAAFLRSIAHAVVTEGKTPQTYPAK